MVRRVGVAGPASRIDFNRPGPAGRRLRRRLVSLADIKDTMRLIERSFLLCL